MCTEGGGRKFFGPPPMSPLFQLSLDPPPQYFDLYVYLCTDPPPPPTLIILTLPTFFSPPVRMPGGLDHMHHFLSVCMSVTGAEKRKHKSLEI